MSEFGLTEPPTPDERDHAQRVEDDTAALVAAAPHDGGLPCGPMCAALAYRPGDLRKCAADCPRRCHD